VRVSVMARSPQNTRTNAKKEKVFQLQPLLGQRNHHQETKYLSGVILSGVE